MFGALFNILSTGLTIRLIVFTASGVGYRWFPEVGWTMQGVCLISAVVQT